MSEDRLGERWMNHRCAECGHLTIRASIHGCVSCLSKREPEAVEVAPVECITAAIDQIERDEYLNGLRCRDFKAALDAVRLAVGAQ